VTKKREAVEDNRKKEEGRRKKEETHPWLAGFRLRQGSGGPP
jgi:hypothetical protein